MKQHATHVATSDATSITVRGRNLVDELIGERSFTEMLYFLICHRFPSPGETRVLDACLVTLMEHGWTPTSIVARLTADSVPGQAQVAIAAGLLAVGDVFAGTMDGCAKLLATGAGEPDPDAWCREVVARHRAQRLPMPGFGHPFHKPDDPRPPRLFQVAEEAGHAGHYVKLLRRLSAELDRAAGKHLTINATGAIAALLLEIGVPTSIMRGVAVVSRAGGLAGHLVEEAQSPVAREIWRLTEHGVPYVPPSE
ncbi:MAG: citryl-CoA lyase [Acetobacteraceae bacterium]|nr:citryl-CoA lyase [Acetobacteraceae bacterium]